MGIKTPPHEEYKEWTTARYWQFIRSALRSAWTKWPPKYKTLAKAKRAYTGKTPRQKYEYQCSKCEKWFPQKNVEVDHIEPAGSLNDYKDLEGFVRRLFVSEDKLRVLCKPCHKSLTHDK